MKIYFEKPQNVKGEKGIIKKTQIFGANIAKTTDYKDCGQDNIVKTAE